MLCPVIIHKDGTYIVRFYDFNHAADIIPYKFDIWREKMRKRPKNAFAIILKIASAGCKTDQEGDIFLVREVQYFGGNQL